MLYDKVIMLYNKVIVVPMYKKASILAITALMFLIYLLASCTPIGEFQQNIKANSQDRPVAQPAQQADTTIAPSRTKTGFSCGDLTQDVEGTLQGTWFYEGKKDCGLRMHFGFAGEQAFIGIHGIIGPEGNWELGLLESGTYNLNFSKAVPGKEYCYNPPKLPGRLLLKFENKSYFKVERVSVKCKDARFRNPVVYSR